MRALPALALACLLLTTLWGCVQPQPPGAPAAVSVLQSEPLHMQANASVQPVVYVILRDTTNKVFGLRALMERTLERRGYAITANASQAGYILQFSIVRAGGMTPATARAAVAAGYDGAIAPAGTGACVLMADVLIATRTIPKKGRQRHVITSTSKRSTVADEQIRVAAMTENPAATYSKAHAELESRVVAAVAEMLPPVPRP